MRQFVWQLVWRHVASVNGSIEIHGEQQVERLVWQHVWQHVASVKALLGAFSMLNTPTATVPLPVG